MEKNGIQGKAKAFIRPTDIASGRIKRTYLEIFSNKTGSEQLKRDALLPTKRFDIGIRLKSYNFVIRTAQRVESVIICIL